MERVRLSRVLVFYNLWTLAWPNPMDQTVIWGQTKQSLQALARVKASQSYSQTLKWQVASQGLFQPKPREKVKQPKDLILLNPRSGPGMVSDLSSITLSTSMLFVEGVTPLGELADAIRVYCNAGVRCFMQDNWPDPKQR